MENHELDDLENQDTIDFFNPNMEIINQLDEESKKTVLGIIKFHKKWRSKLETEFLKEIKSLKPLFKKQGLYIPNNPLSIFKEFFEAYKKIHLLDNPPKENSEIKFYSLDEHVKRINQPIPHYPNRYELGKNAIICLPEPKIDPTFLLEWAKKFTLDLSIIVKEEIEIEEVLPGSVRYLILLEFFEFKKEHKTLSENQKVKLLSVILEKGFRTTKGYKNGEEKYITTKNKAEATVLINKVKKGDFL
jgi:hypothetical protein